MENKGQRRHSFRIPQIQFTQKTQRKDHLSRNNEKTTRKGCLLCPLFMKEIKGSGTVEALLVMPIVITFIMFVGWFIDSIRIHSEMEAIVSETGSGIVNYSYAYNRIINGDGNSQELLKTIGSVGLSKLYLENKITESDIGDRIDLLSCIVENVTEKNTIKIKVSYRTPMPFSIPGFKGMILTNSFYSKEYLGKEKIEKSNEYVFVTKGSEVYHKTESCTALKTTIQTVVKEDVDKKRNTDGKKYYPCKKCEDEKKVLVFITPYGNRYHTKEDCSDLKVTVYKIPKTEIGERKRCYFCE